MSATVSVTMVGEGRVACVLRSPMGRRLELSGPLAGPVAEAIEGDDEMLSNAAMVNNAWAYAKHSIAALEAAEPDDEKSQLAQAGVHEEIAREISGVAPRPTRPSSFRIVNLLFPPVYKDNCPSSSPSPTPCWPTVMARA